MTDQEIVDALREKDFMSATQALKVLYKRNYHVVESYIVKNSGSKEDAKDMFQDSIIILYKNLKRETFVLNGKLSSYLYSVSRNLWLKKLRDTKITTANIDDYSNTIAFNENVLSIIEYTENQKMIAALLKRAGDKCRMLLRAFYYKRLSMKNIAVNQGYSSEQIAKNQKVRCLKKIRLILSNSGGYFENLENGR